MRQCDCYKQNGNSFPATQAYARHLHHVKSQENTIVGKGILGYDDVYHPAAPAARVQALRFAGVNAPMNMVQFKGILLPNSILQVFY